MSEQVPARLLSGPAVPLPEDMPEMPDDLKIIARLIDANCRAYNEEYGWHLDSRCLSHYNEGIVRLAQAGIVSLKPMLERNGSGLPQKARSGEPVIYEEVTDAPAQAVRVRATYVPFDQMTDRPTMDPMWKLQAEEMTRLRMEIQELRSRPPSDGLPEGVAPASVRDAMATPPSIEVPEWLRTAPKTPVPDPSTMPGAARPMMQPPSE